MFLVRPPLLLTKILFNLTWRIPNQEKNIFLTFDDGPVPESTPWVLNTLKQFDAKATFFCVGENVQKYPELFQQILKQGHSVGNHTFNHLVGWKHSTAHYLANIAKADELIHSKLFRPPHGRMTNAQKKHIKKDKKIIMWDVLSGDYDASISRQTCLQNVLKYAKTGSVIVFHDSIKASKNMRYAFPKTLEHFSKQGYQFKAIEKE